MPGTSNVYVTEPVTIDYGTGRWRCHCGYWVADFKGDPRARGRFWSAHYNEVHAPKPFSKALTQVLPPLREHGPEQDGRWCLRHYRKDGWGPFLNRRSSCFDCEDEEHQQWQDEVREKLHRGLVAAAEGREVQW